MEAANGRQAWPGVWLGSPNWAAIMLVQVRFGDQLALQALRGHPGQLLMPASRFTRYRDESHSVES